MKIQTLSSIIAVWTCIGLCSCYSDKGNYTYSEFPKIEVSGIEKDYGTKELFVDKLVVEPAIKFGDEGPESFEMAWYRQLTDTLIPVSTGELNLVIPLTVAGKNDFLFEITHKKWGFSYRFKTTVFVNSKMERGFYILKETAGGDTEIDGFICEDVQHYVKMPNLIEGILGHPLSGSPVELQYTDWQYPNPETETIEKRRILRPVSKKDMIVIGTTDFAKLADMEQLVTSDIDLDNIEIEALKNNSETAVLIYNGGKIRSMSVGTFSRFMSEYNGDYEIEPYLNMASSGGQGFVFDKKHSSFKMISSTTTSLRVQSDLAWGVVDGKFVTDLYMPNNNLNANLKYFGRASGNMGIMNYRAGIGYALLEKRTSPDSLLLFRMSHNEISRNTGGNYSQVAQIDTLPNISRLKYAERYAIHEYSQYLYFTIGGKVWSYNLTTFLDSGKHLLDFGTEEITYMKYIRANYDIIPEYNFDCLVIGTHVGGNYKLYFYKVTAGVPGELWQTLEGEGKLKTFVYAAPGSSAKSLYIYL